MSAITPPTLNEDIQYLSSPVVENKYKNLFETMAE